MRRMYRSLLAAVLCVLTACASTLVKSTVDIVPQAGIGPFSEFSGRLLVMEPHRNWQVLMQWHAEQPGQGWLRLTHAASSNIFELRWQQQAMQMRSSREPGWRDISPQQLADQGIVMPPQQLARLLLGQRPEHFIRKVTTGNDHEMLVWESQGQSQFVRLQWQPSSRRLTMTDMTHGRRAILIIQSDPKPASGKRP